ncbi:MAG: hypothetical protein P8049_08495 [Gemmatimonadota bacterium]
MNNDLPPVSGFSIVRNASIYDYPVEVALASVLPLVDELHVNVGRSDDDTLDRVLGIDDPRIRVHETDWGDPTGRNTRDLGEETNRVMAECSHDWSIYIQADEVLHEEDLPAIRRALARAVPDPRVEGLAFDYLHFYGSPEWHLRGRAAFRAEVRMIRRSSGARAFGGAQGFRIGDRLPRVLDSGGRIFHYGYVKSEKALTEKLEMGAIWRGEDPDEVGEWEFTRPVGLVRFTGTHPAVALPWISGRTWPFDPRSATPEPLSFRSIRYRGSDLVEKVTGWRPFEHRTFELLDG